MRGSMRERPVGSKRWELRADLGRDPQSGKRFQRSRVFRGKKGDAERELARLVAEVDAERAPGTDGTFAHTLDQWLSWAEPRLSPTTFSEYRRLVDNVITPRLGTVPLRKLTGRQLDELYQAEEQRGLAPGSVNQVHAVCRRSLNQAVKWGWIPTNPALMATPPQRRAKEQEIPTVKQLADMIALVATGTPELDHVDADPVFAMVLRVAAAIGARRGELCGLRWSDVDLEAGTITIRQAVVVVKDHTAKGTVQAPRPRKVVAKGTKTHGVRTLHVDAGTMELLRIHRELMDERARALAPGGELVAGAYVFSRDFDGASPLRPGWVSNAFKAFARKASMPESTHLHSLRHLNASLQLASGVKIATVSKRHGHAQQSTTINIYSHVMPDDDAAAADVLGRLLGG